MEKFLVYSRVCTVVEMQDKTLILRLPEAEGATDPIRDLLVKTIARAVNHEEIKVGRRTYMPWAPCHVEWVEEGSTFLVLYYWGHHHCGDWVKWSELTAREDFFTIFRTLFDTHHLDFPNGAD